MGLRVTVECPVPVGLEQPIVITLQEGKDCYHLVVHSAIVRWANGCVAGCEFLQIDELDHTRVTDFLEQREREAVRTYQWLRRIECARLEESDSLIL